MNTIFFGLQNYRGTVVGNIRGFRILASVSTKQVLLGLNSHRGVRISLLIEPCGGLDSVASSRDNTPRKRSNKYSWQSICIFRGLGREYENILAWMI